MRLAFAVAAHLEPEILLVDEVLAVGDAAFQKKCLGKMGDVSRQGRTVLFVSHNMGAISQLCRRCILLERGMLSLDGSPGDVIARYVGNTAQVEEGTEWERTGSGKVHVRIVKLFDENDLVKPDFFHGPAAQDGNFGGYSASEGGVYIDGTDRYPEWRASIVCTGSI